MKKILIKEENGNIVTIMGVQAFATPRNSGSSFFQDIDSLLNEELDAAYQKMFGKELFCNSGITVEIEHEGGVYHWAWNLAHYCFVKSRLSEEDFADLIKKS